MHGPVHRFGDDIHDRVCVVEYFVIPEPQNLEAATFKKFGALSIIVELLTVLAAIRLNDPSRFPTEKINKIPPDRDLPMKLHPHQ